MTSTTPNTIEKNLGVVEKQFASVFDKAPHVPQGFKDFLVAIAPWLALIFGVLGLVSILGAGMLGMLMSMSFLQSGMMGAMFFVSLVAGLLVSLLDLMAFGPLRKREKKGWNYIFLGQLVSLVAAIINVAVGLGSGIAIQIVMMLVGFWLLFEVRGMYR